MADSIEEVEFTNKGVEAKLSSVDDSVMMKDSELHAFQEMMQQIVPEVSPTREYSAIDGTFRDINKTDPMLNDETTPRGYNRDDESAGSESNKSKKF